MRPRLNGPFVLTAHDIVRKPGEMRAHSLTLRVPEQWGEGLVVVPKDTPLDLAVRLESVHEGILVTADAATTMSGECGRCLTPITRSVEVDIQELFEYPGGESADFEVQDDHVDLETLVREAVVLSLPFQPVCQPDCPGLDPVTGERMAHAPDETQQVPVDPRWAALQELNRQPAHDAENTEES